MKYAYFFITLALLSSCNPNSKKSKSDESVISLDSLTDKEVEYLKIRDVYIEQFKPFERSPYSDSLSKVHSEALLDLEIRLQEILKDSRYTGQGKINLEVLIPSMGFGMMDGLWFEKDSMRIIYTSKNLFLDYFKARSIESLMPEGLEGVFQCAYASNSYILDFSHIKISSSKSNAAYGMVGLGGQDTGPYPPQFLFTFVSNDKYIYLIQRLLKKPVKELPQCKSVWDSFGKESLMSMAERDTAFLHFCKCYQIELSSDPQFKGIQKQLESMVKYVEP